ncbi:tetratricopeptide (TPR) repeat protein [Methylopila capsulata]|uniref:Tetratricopeptide (TPR) repeat protein n=1 Tax=Methylopila capsulata TaxID=61654 RepID=A0A9W6IY60_9HYPH|nr:tetratricopeptide repeat protein [Methylopila capsulata]MBM7853471.1 tetratricopeptide (TPR) repeat protein [Methylopila capsulata]GLK57315.1 hypothetical protein GCM10008170_33350 [Methylopila capsulata]
MMRFHLVATVVVALGLGCVGASAQPAPPLDGSPETTTPILPTPPGAAPPSPPAADPAVTGESANDSRGKAVDELLARLAKTDDPQTAKRIAMAVQALWIRSGSDTIDLLTSRALEAQRKANTGMALKLLGEVVSLKPEFAEGWSRRAAIHVEAKDYDQAMVDIHETLLREPRHFGVWIGLGRILQESGLDAKALAAYRRAYALYPAAEGLKREIDELTLKVEGQPI